jgi:hypothetical protein
MSTSRKQIKANRANAKKSTGPKTPEGKRISSRNAITHGLYSRDLIVDSPHLKENKEEYDLILTALKLELEPQGVLQEFLVRKIANCLWRSGRVVRAETAQIKRQLYFMNDSMPHTIALGVNAIPKGAADNDILRYELRVERQLSRTLNLLMRLKKIQSSSHSDPFMDYVTAKLPGLPPDETACDVGGRCPHLPQDYASAGDESSCLVPAGLADPPTAGPCDLPGSDEETNIVGPPENEQTNPIPPAMEDINPLPNK